MRALDMLSCNEDEANADAASEAEWDSLAMANPMVVSKRTLLLFKYLDLDKHLRGRFGLIFQFAHA